MIFIILLVAVSSVGCAKITYEDGKFSYTRWLNQEFEGLELEKTEGGSVFVKVDKQKGGIGDIDKIAEGIAKGVVAGMVPGK